ncbi:MAG: nucleotidyl transferase AbiEii/AbiGii toxin family protein [Candidatus Woesearchaeota archaeon]
MKIPLSVRIKKEQHRKIAYAQDMIVEEVYRFFERAVLHGGTAIWRCYDGKRFSEDLDFYLTKDRGAIDTLFDALEKKGFKILKKKTNENSLYSELMFERVNVRLEATFQKIQGHLADYETSDGNIISIYSLTPEEFTIEKVNTYLKRNKIRDLWDIYFLLKKIRNISVIKKELEKLIRNYKPPIDEKDLKIIILEGITPTSKEMLEYVKRIWENINT